MSVERELLVEALEWMEELNYVWLNSRISGDSIALELRADINKIELLLTQPEQPNEPVAWRCVNFTEAEGDWLYRDIDEPFTNSNYRNVGEALYLAPQKREPLSDEHLGDLVDYCSGYPMALGRAVEMAHDITGVGDE